ncbi:hypothetical protein Pmani_005700 [Petrolisthes manimaculis]|uniref:Uncharacterized protein n=1 Tax=Petrolisthes manimaculis TaxID=1843537 RepID=A0AAE1UMP2_9EUCA|nr:hypothetical protein Pmani_005700 [Petrolisthes manimaculis]
MPWTRWTFISSVLPSIVGHDRQSEKLQQPQPPLQDSSDQVIKSSTIHLHYFGILPTQHHFTLYRHGGEDTIQQDYPDSKPPTHQNQHDIYYQALINS